MDSISIPETCGVMLLPDCTLFPHGGLPLRIFEPRYRQMLSEALAGTCFFAVARLTDEKEDNPAASAALIGTIGLIRASREMDDGTSNLLLHGVVRVRFVEWQLDALYPTARIQPVPAVFEPKQQEEAAAEALREAADKAANMLPEEAAGTIREMTSKIDDPAILADVLAQQFIHDPDERQDLLEMEQTAERIAWLCRKLGA